MVDALDQLSTMTANHQQLARNTTTSCQEIDMVAPQGYSKIHQNDCPIAPKRTLRTVAGHAHIQNCVLRRHDALLGQA